MRVYGAQIAGVSVPPHQNTRGIRLSCGVVVIFDLTQSLSSKVCPPGGIRLLAEPLATAFARWFLASRGDRVIVLGRLRLDTGLEDDFGMQRMDFETLVQTRKSVRGFKKEPVPRAVIEDIIEVAKRAGSRS